MTSSYNKFSESQLESNLSELVEGFGLTKEEAKVALEICKDDEIECKRRLVEDEDFFDTIRDIMLVKKYPSRRRKTTRKSQELSINKDPAIKIKITINENEILNESKLASSSKSRSKRNAASSDIAKLINSQISKSKKKVVKKGFKENGQKRAKNIRLSEALKLLRERKLKSKKRSPKKKFDKEVGLGPEESVTVDGVTYTRSDLESVELSDARIKSFLSINTNPNSFYYRFNHPGEDHKTGLWSKEEVENFMSLIKDGCNYRWGEFSMKVPGRVGYQCSNFYRKLIEDGVISDPNYVIVNGKLKFLGKDGKRFSRKKEDEERKKKAKEDRERLKALKRLGKSDAPKRKRKKKRKKRKRTTVRGEDVIGYSTEEETESDSEFETTGVELIKGLKCPMTMSAVKNPTLSPFGHIMSYDVWVKVLSKIPKNTCPFTHQRLTRRSLIKLNAENIEKHLDSVLKVKPDFKLSDIKSS